MKRLSFLGGAVVLGCAALLAGRSHAADHIDSNTLATAGMAMADISDVYAWMAPDGGKVNLVMTVSPDDTGARNFSPGVQYVFHVTSKPGDPAAVVAQPGGVETKVICTFASNTSAQCWVVGANGVKDYVSGDPSNPAGLPSMSGKVRLFAGRRADPFFFNLQAFRDTVTNLRTVATTFVYDAAQCPTSVDTATAETLRMTLGQTRPAGTPPCPNNQADCFLNLNVMAIVVQVDKALLNQTGNLYLGVWGSTHAGS